MMKFWIAFFLSFIFQIIALILTLYGDIIITPILFFFALFIIAIWGIVNYND
jgi:predicted membrane protein